MKLIVKTAGAEPISLADAKSHLRVTHNLDDAYITLLIAVARDKFERDTKRACLETVYELYLDNLKFSQEFDCDILLYKCPVLSVDEIAVLATDDASAYTALTASTYKTDIVSEPGRIYFTTQPSYGDTMHAIKVTFKAGYSAVPPSAIHAMKLLIGHLYENRQNVVTGTQVNSVPMTYEYLIEQFKYTI